MGTIASQFTSLTIVYSTDYSDANQENIKAPRHRPLCGELHQPRLWFITGGYLVKRWFIPAAARARGQSNDLNRGILTSNLFNCHNKGINAPPIPSISRCIHIVYWHKNVWEYQLSNFIYNCMSTFLHYVHCKDALLECSAPGGERCESLTWIDEIHRGPVYSPHKWPVTRKMFPFDDVIMWCWTGDKPLPKTMLTKFTDTYIRQWRTITWIDILNPEKKHDRSRH